MARKRRYRTHAGPESHRINPELKVRGSGSAHRRPGGKRHVAPQTRITRTQRGMFSGFRNVTGYRTQSGKRYGH